MLRTGPNQSAIKLKNVAQPQYYLAVIGGYLVGYVRIGPYVQGSKIVLSKE